MQQSYLFSNKKRVRDTQKKRALKDSLKEAATFICSMCRTIPPTGKSSGTTLGVPSEALLHRHDARRPALYHREEGAKPLHTKDPSS